MKKEIKNLDKLAKRLLLAVKNKEKIILYGDSDLDGIASVILVKESLKTLGLENVIVYFSDRHKDGYGLNKRAIANLKKQLPAILMILDMGISNFEEIKLAKKTGFEVLIVDHHEVLDKKPEADIIVDPKDKEDPYPFKGLANSGIVFRLTKLLFGRKFSRKLKESFLELVALATIADMMPKEKENRLLIANGLRLLPNTVRPGLKTLLKVIGKECGRHPAEICQKAVSILNFNVIKSHLAETYRLLVARNEEEALPLVIGLIEENKDRQMEVKQIFEIIKERAARHPEPAIYFEGNKNWQLLFLGTVASKICSQYKKPVFIFRMEKTDSRGAVRTPKGTSGIEAMKSCQKYLISFGGHHLAAGFCLKTKNLEKFKTCLISFFEKSNEKNNYLH